MSLNGYVLSRHHRRRCFCRQIVCNALLEHQTEAQLRCVNEGSDSFTCPPTFTHKWNEPSCRASPQYQMKWAILEPNYMQLLLLWIWAVAANPQHLGTHCRWRAQRIRDGIQEWVRNRKGYIAKMAWISSSHLNSSQPLSQKAAPEVAENQCHWW